MAASARRLEPDPVAQTPTSGQSVRSLVISSESVAESGPPPQDHKRWHDVATDHVRNSAEQWPALQLAGE
jgi:hypothetical protein